MRFDVRALSPDLVVTKLVLDARDEEDVCRQVAQQGFVATDIRHSGPVGAITRGGYRGRQFSLVLFSQELLALLGAGLALVEGLEALHEKESDSARRTVLARLLTALQNGKRLSTALSEQPDAFPALFVGLIRAAEGTSELPRSLSRFIEYRQRIDTVKSKVISASIYPAILLVVGGAVASFLIGYVVPRFAEVYRDSGRTLPWLSQLLLDWGRFAGNHTQEVVVTALLSAVIAVGVAWHSMQRGGMLRILSRLPGLGERIRVYELARLYLTLGMLLEGGISLVPAMQTARDVVSTGTRLKVDRARDDIESGKLLSSAFEHHDLATPVSLRMLRVGERSGTLDILLVQAAAFYEGEIGRWIDHFTRTFEPLLMAAIGIVVGTIVVLLYMPIFDLAGSLP